MKVRSLIAMMIVGWFFTVRGVTNVPGIWLTQEFEGFKTQNECEAAKAVYVQYLEDMGATVTVSKCQVRVGS